ncbi:MAG: hypothetical protein O2999_06540 [Nitrospirae bacterium]|nr:hypothetical protein [Nitrospirota bacterium]MDA1303941.1 hypothetical protein [Nitrospirota bacterium]
MPTIRILAIILLCALGGCASTLYPGPWTHVPVTTNPPGATLHLAGYTYMSPALVWVPRKSGDFKLSIYKKGYRPGHVFLRQSPDYLWGLNVTPVGFLADMRTGAAYDVEPETVDFVLIPNETFQQETGP